MTDTTKTLLDHLTIPSRLQYFKEHYGEREAFVFYSTSGRDALTFRQLYDFASRFAWKLHEHGFKRYDVIANTLPNSPERVITDIGILFAGCTPMNGQILLADGEDFYHSARVSRCQAVVMCPRGGSPAWRLMMAAVQDPSTSEMFTGMQLPGLDELNTAILINRSGRCGVNLLDDVVSGGWGSYVDADITPDDLMVVFTTSGSTGFSKLVARPNRFVFSWLNEFEDLKKQFDANKSLFNNRPFGWLGGCPIQTYSVGVRQVALDDFLEKMDDAKAHELACKAIVDEGCANLALLSYQGFLSHVKQHGIDLKSKGLMTGGQPFTKKQVDEMLEVFAYVVIGYGQTETSMIAMDIAHAASNPYEDYRCGNIDNVGMFGVTDTRIVNTDLKDCQPGEIGTLWIKGKNVVTSYFNLLDDEAAKPKKTFLPDGWFNTEDNAFLDDERNLFLIGRNNDIITFGSYVVYPGWLEKKMATHPDILDVAIVPVSDPILFHNICACVQPVEGKELDEVELKDFARKMFLTSAKSESTPMPKYFMILEALPLNQNGKLDRAGIKRMAEEKFGRKE